MLVVMPLPRTTPIRLICVVAILGLGLPFTGPSTPSVAGAAHSTLALWEWPVDPPKRVVRAYVPPATPYGPGHRGVDLAAGPGDAVYAPADGVVFFAGVVVDRPVLSIRHPGGLLSSFEPVRSNLAAGTAVKRGERIGTLLAGHCAAGCLHFGVRLYGQYLSPLKYLTGIPHSVLLPVRPLP